VVFLGAFAIGRRVAAPIEQARQRQMDFTANASHELRTPLAVIQAQTSLALTQPRGADWYQRAFERVNEESKRMRVMVDDLLWLARFEAMPPSKTEPVDVAVMAQQAADRFAAVAEARRQRLSVRLSGDSHVIAALPEWLDHLIGVLLDNACKFSPADTPIEVDVRGGVVEVRDRGVGVASDERSRVFDRFYRAAAARSQPGSGLGRAIVRQIAELHGGTVELLAREGGGTIARLTLPTTVDV